MDSPDSQELLMIGTIPHKELRQLEEAASGVVNFFLCVRIVLAQLTFFQTNCLSF